MDPDAFRRESRRRWGAAARGWAAHPELVRAATMPVTLWLLDAIEPQPGHRVLELAAGTGDVGFMAAELIRPGGELITSDWAPEMLTVAQERAAELGVEGVRFKQVDAESIDLEAGSLDAVLCRWGYMLMADPEAALRETRRVLRPGGRVALSAWTAPEENPWAAVPAGEMLAHGVMPQMEPGTPNLFSWAEPGLIEEQLAAVGFVDGIRVEAIAWEYAYPGFDAWWRTMVEMSPSVGIAVDALEPAARERLFAGLRRTLEPYTAPDGSLALGARSWVAVAVA